MNGLRGAKEDRAGRAFYVLAAFFFALVLFAPSLSHAQSVVLNHPRPGAGVNDTFKWRERHPVTHQPKPHKGMDYDLNCGTNLTPPNGGSFNCPDNGGRTFSGIATSAHACGIVERFIHLQSCNASSMVTGGAKGMRGAGGTTGCHLHYEILIDGTAVNPPSAYGKNLCDPEIRKQLIAEAQQILHNQAGGGGGSTSSNNPNTSPQPPAQPPPVQTPSADGTTMVYVPWSPSNPTGGYYEVIGADGRVVGRIPSGGVNGHVVALPPTTEEFTQTGDTNNPVTGCATDTWTAMVNQAVLQTRREMAINQRYIAKPDSVMAYSCLGDQLTLVGEHAGVLSETQLWANKQIDILNGNTATVTVNMGQSSLDGAIVNVATEPYERFIRSYFDHGWLGEITGGGADGGGEGGDDEGPSQDHAICGTMNMVWQMAKCMNVTDDPLFPRFEELISNDPRRYPENYRCNDSGITQNMIDIARGRDVRKDNVDTYIRMLYPGTCHTPIQTGITVHRREGEEQISTERTYPDGLCITIGCSYQNAGNGNGRCEIKQP